jgi:hypothetical protein
MLIEQVEQCLGQMIDRAFGRQVLCFSAGHQYYARRAKRQVRLSQSQVDQGVLRLELRTVGIGDGGFAPIALGERLFALLQVGCYIDLCFQRSILRQMVAR